MGIVRNILLIALALLLQTSWVHKIAIFGILPDLILLALVYIGISGGQVEGTTFGFTSGFLLDVYDPEAMGINTLTNSIVSGNTASSSGSGIFNSGGTLTVTDSTVSGNTAPGSGGGILNSNGGSLTITNSTVSENGASGTGGGIWTQGTVTLTNSTVSGNTAGTGGGIHNSGGAAESANTIIAGNTGGAPARTATALLGPWAIT